MADKDNKDIINRNDDMENSSYEVIKDRLKSHGQDLSNRIEKLNTARKEVFGSIETKLLGSERIITDNNCVPRDMAPINDSFIFGYNVHIGLKSKVKLNDVFSIYKYIDNKFEKQTLEIVNDIQFVNDFEELYEYYKDTFFAKFTIVNPYFYMIFQTGKNANDIKAFKWLIRDGTLVYIDNRSDHEAKFINGTDFDFIATTRDDQRNGMHPHVSVCDKVFVETINGDLTIKIEDNTSSGKGIYSEPVEDKDQSLDDAEISYVELDQIMVLKIRPYNEKEDRYFIFNDKLKSVTRVDSIKDGCKLLPSNHGAIFPHGYYLKSGEYKVFDVECETPVFDQMVQSSNGEDFQYIFYDIENGTYLIYTYNMIEQTIDTPIVCSGYSHFDNGEMIVFKSEQDPRKNHIIQIWQTPFVGKNYVVGYDNDSALVKIGNKDIVNCMSDCKVVQKLIEKGEKYQSIYVDLVNEVQTIIDSYFWLEKSEALNLKEVLFKIKETSAFAIGEFEKATRIKKATKKQIEHVKEESEELLKRIDYGTFDSTLEYVEALADVRKIRGKIATLRDLRYTNIEFVDELDKKVKEKNEALSQQCVEFLIEPQGLKPYEDKINSLQSDIQNVNKSSEGNAVFEKMNHTASDLELLIDIVGNIKIEDPTKVTDIIEKISTQLSLINNAKARLKTKVDEFNKSEMETQFNAQMKLLSQAVVNYLDISDTVDKCDEYLNKIMIQIQELESKFAEFDEYIIKLSEEREDLYNAFESKKQSIIDKLNKRVIALFGSAERILSGISNRLKGFESVDEINAYIATDIMAEKVRDVDEELRELGDNVKADEISSKLKTLKEEAIRQLKDKQDLFVSGENVIKFGEHHFSVNTKDIELSMVQKDDGMYYHITGTDFWDKVTDSELDKYQYVYGQSAVSENKDVYRAEYLAYLIFEAAKNGEIDSLDDLYVKTEEQLTEVVREFMEPRYQEDYTKGVHDIDAGKILHNLLELHHNIDLLIYKSETRACARLFWNFLADKDTKRLVADRLEELAKVGAFFNTQPSLENYMPYLMHKLNAGYECCDIFETTDIQETAEYLCKELMNGDDFIVSKEAKRIYDGFIKYLREKKVLDQFLQSIDKSKNDIEGLFYLVKEWINAYEININGRNKSDEKDEENNNPFIGILENETSGICDEVIVLLIENSAYVGRVVNVDSNVMVSGLVGTHSVINRGEYRLSYAEFMEKLRRFSDVEVKDFITFQTLKKELIEKFKNEVSLEDFKPNVLSSFVRNKLIDEVYLPLIGDNLAKQIGVVGKNKRTDLMGMLLLVSPPGYGKTTLMEYIASRLGIILVKINGPSIGYDVTSLDPAKAKNISAQAELKKLNLALKMGNNVMIYVDDIQHCNPEFLQKFISLCDGQRKIDGVYNGKGQTYDLRNKKVAVVMAGNPYTESGEKFKIPDMLSNRADVYNLGDMLSENEEAFKLSYIENSLTSNPVLSKLASRSFDDLYGIIKLANGVDRESVHLESDFSMDEISEYTSVISKLFKVRDVVLKINMEYIYSAAQADEYRKEPPFKLQGSYRNMNKIAEKIVPIMNEEELFQRILNSYENDSQTLTSDTEANMLKWKEIIGCLNSDEEKRYNEIKETFEKNKSATGDEKLSQAVGALTSLAENMTQIKDVLTSK